MLHEVTIRKNISSKEYALVVGWSLPCWAGKRWLRKDREALFAPLWFVTSRAPWASEYLTRRHFRSCHGSQFGPERGSRQIDCLSVLVPDRHLVSLTHTHYCHQVRYGFECGD